MKMDDKELKQWREDYIRLEQDYRREVPEMKQKQILHANAINELQTAEANRKQNTAEIADASIERWMKQKGRRLERWTPIIVQLIIAAGVLGVAYIGYLGIIAQLKGIIP